MFRLQQSLLIPSLTLCLLYGLAPFFCNHALSNELGVDLDAHSYWMQDRSDLHGSELQIDAHISRAMMNGQFHTTLRARIDSETDLNQSHQETLNNYSSASRPLLYGEQGELRLREFWWQYTTENLYWKLGKQQVVWGEADGLKVLDVINPQDYREFILDRFEDSRIPLWMVNTEIFLPNNASLEVLLIPDTTTHELPPSHAPFQFTSPLLVKPFNPGISVQDEGIPESILDGDIGFRYIGFSQGWDFTLNYLNHLVDAPIFRTATNGDEIFIIQDYERSQLYGLTGSSAFDGFTLRLEAAYETDRYFLTRSGLEVSLIHDSITALVAVDINDFGNSFLSFQLLQKTINDYDQRLVEEQHANTITLLWRRSLWQETVTVELLQIHSLTYHDGLTRTKFVYNLQSHIDLTLSSDFFQGDDRGLFGQFDHSDRVSVGVSASF